MRSPETKATQLFLKSPKGGTMKRDMDLIRAILLKVEEEQAPDERWNDIQIDGYDRRVVHRHVDLLAQTGFLDVEPATDRDMLLNYHINGLDWDGHEFLEASRNEDVWEKMKRAAQDKSLSLTLEVAQAVLKALAMKKLGLSNDS